MRFTQKCMRFLREFQKTGTLLFVSHDVGAVTSLCSRAIWLDHGELKMDGNAKETVEAYLAEQHALDRGALGVSVKVGAAKQRKPRKKTELDVVDARWEKLRAQGAARRSKYSSLIPSRLTASSAHAVRPSSMPCWWTSMASN